MLQGDLSRVFRRRKRAFLDGPKVTECLATILISFSLEFALISACQQVPPNLESKGVRVTLAGRRSRWSSPYWSRCHRVANSIDEDISPKYSMLRLVRIASKHTFGCTLNCVVLCVLGYLLGCPDTAPVGFLWGRSKQDTQAAQSHVCRWHRLGVHLQCKHSPRWWYVVGYAKASIFLKKKRDDRLPSLQFHNQWMWLCLIVVSRVLLRLLTQVSTDIIYNGDNKLSVILQFQLHGSCLPWAFLHVKQKPWFKFISIEILASLRQTVCQNHF